MTTENNKIIAEFMGLNKTKMFFNLKTGNYVKKETADCDIKVVDVYLKNNKPITNFYYHSDWNWLMEVVEKIESLGYYVNITGTYVSIGAIESKTNPIFIEKDSNIKIEAVYNACVEFIKWYNSHLCSNCGRFDDVVGTHNIDTCEECALNS